MDTQLEALVTSIHSSPTKAVFYITGGAVAALSWLLSVPGASRTVLEASIPYAQKASDQLLGCQPVDSYSGTQQSVHLAKAAYQRAAELTDVGECNFVGVAAACALATDRPKKGDHKCSISVHTPLSVKTYSAILDKGLRSRAEEDILASRILVMTLAEASGLYSAEETQNLLHTYLSDTEKKNIKIEVTEFLSPISSLLNGHVQCVEFCGTDFVLDAPRRNALVLPGSFNPLHDGHLQMLQTAERETGKRGLFELSVVNPDKGTLDEETVQRRLLQFCDKGLPLLLTRASLFRDKSALLLNCTFLVGYDTAVRIVQPKYYQGSESNMLIELGYMRNRECGFLVAGRAVDMDGKKKFLTLEDAEIPVPVRDMFVSLDGFRVDISSTEIRSQHTTGD